LGAGDVAIVTPLGGLVGVVAVATCGVSANPPAGLGLESAGRRISGANVGCFTSLGEETAGAVGDLSPAVAVFGNTAPGNAAALTELDGEVGSSAENTDRWKPISRWCSGRSRRPRASVSSLATLGATGFPTAGAGERSAAKGGAAPLARFWLGEGLAAETVRLGKVTDDVVRAELAAGDAGRGWFEGVKPGLSL
jgi:hypothetical protein